MAIGYRQIAGFALTALLLLVSRPAFAQTATSHEAICQGLDKKATELMDAWRSSLEEISNDPYDDKLRRLRDRYDYIHYRLEWVRDESRREGCSGLHEAIDSVFRQWERP